MKISIITATYKSASTLKDTIESVWRQTYPHIEYIVVDGNVSDDNDPTSDIIAQYQPQFGERLIYIHEPDQSLYDAMNKGFNRATGDVIGILNSDDFFTSTDIIARVAEALESHPETDAVYGDVHYVSPHNLNRCSRYYSSRLFRPSWMRFGFMPAHPSFYCRAEVYKEHGTFDISYRVAADFELLLRLIYVARIRTLYLPLDFVTMRLGGASNANINSHRQIMRDHRRALRQWGIASSHLLLSLRYVYKVGELIWSKVRY